MEGRNASGVAVKKSKTFKFQAREARQEDAERIMKLSDQLGYPSSAVQISQRLRKILKTKNHIVYVAAVNDEGIIGWIHVFLCPLIVRETTALIGGLAADERYRLAGGARRLVEKAEE